MSSRRYPAAEVYEERERNFYDRPRAERNYEELDIDIQRARYPVAERAETVVSDARRPRQPDFLREDYGRTEAGALVVQERQRSEVGSRRGPPGPPARLVKDEMVIRERDNFSDSRSRRRGPERVDREEILIRERDRVSEPKDRPREREVREVDREEIGLRRGDRQPERERPRRRLEVEETDIRIRRGGEDDYRSQVGGGGGGGGRGRGERDAGGGASENDVREDIVFRRGDGPPRERVVERDEIVLREETRSPPRREYREREVDREELIVHERERERSIPPVRNRSLGPPIVREREQFVFRRREPSPPRDFEREEIIIRRREQTPPREPSPEPEPVREPSPELIPIRKPPIIQEYVYPGSWSHSQVSRISQRPLGAVRQRLRALWLIEPPLRTHLNH